MDHCFLHAARSHSYIIPWGLWQGVKSHVTREHLKSINSPWSCLIFQSSGSGNLPLQSLLPSWMVMSTNSCGFSVASACISPADNKSLSGWCCDLTTAKVRQPQGVGDTFWDKPCGLRGECCTVLLIERGPFWMVGQRGSSLRALSFKRVWVPWEGRLSIHGNSLYFPFNFAVNLVL